jgi:hypothetical protein
MGSILTGSIKPDASGLAVGLLQACVNKLNNIILAIHAEKTFEASLPEIIMPKLFKEKNCVSMVISSIIITF